MPESSFHVGTDIGGTFTDVWIQSSDGWMRVFKAPTTADAISGVLDALRLAATELGLDLSTLCSRITRFGHGTTRGLNALLTGNVAKTAVLTTWGFGDTLEIGRLKHQYTGLNEIEVSDLYLRHQHQQLVSRKCVFEFAERINSNGDVVQPLHIETARQTILGLRDSGVRAVAICLLWSTRNPTHELDLRNLCTSVLPDAFTSVSHEVSQHR